MEVLACFYRHVFIFSRLHYLNVCLGHCVTVMLICVCVWLTEATEDRGAGVWIHILTALLSHIYLCACVCLSGTLCRCNARLCVCVSVTEATEDRGAGMLLPTLHSYSHRSTLCTHRRQPAQQRYAGFPCLLRPDLQNILRRCYHNAKVTIDLRWTSNLQNILRLAFVN